MTGSLNEPGENVVWRMSFEDAPASASSCAELQAMMCKAFSLESEDSNLGPCAKSERSYLSLQSLR